MCHQHVVELTKSVSIAKQQSNVSSRAYGEHHQRFKKKKKKVKGNNNNRYEVQRRMTLANLCAECLHLFIHTKHETQQK
jgi:hypothetical protein